MSDISNYLENAVINHFLRGNSQTSPSKVYLALYKTDPTDDDTGTEVSGGGYIRKEITLGAPTNGVTKNTTDVEFPIATADWGTVTHGGVRDAATGGNLLLHGPLQTNKIIESGDQFRIPANQLTFTLT